MRRHLLVVLLVLAAARPVGAQDRVTVFVHGFNSSAATWQQTAARLGARLQLAPFTVTLPWHQPYDSQAALLHSQATAAGAPANMVVVGHSNGGVIARQLSIRRPLGGIVTIGSPHQGAPLARTIEGASQFYLNTGQKLGLLLFMLGASGGTNQFTGIYYSPGLAPLRLAISALGVALQYAAGSVQAAIQPIVTAPVLADMTPGSAALTALNSSGNLAREQSAVPRRVGIVHAARDWWIGAPFVAGAPHLQYSGENAVRDGMRYLSFIEAYFSYPNFAPYDPVATTIRLQARSIISDLLNFNAAWCVATTGVANCSVSTDGVVPTESQFYPGANANIGRYGSAHILQTSQSDDVLVEALAGHVGLRTRDGSSPGGPGSGAPASTLSPGERLYPDTEVRSPSGAYRLRYQSDGNLVLYGPDGALWSSGTAGQGGHFAEMQPDGNLVVYHASGADPWESGTAGIPNAQLRVQDDGYIVIYDTGGNVPWYEPR